MFLSEQIDAYSSWVQLEGLSIRWPSFSSLKSSSTGIPGYGDPPNVKISHIKTPKDQLWKQESKNVSAPRRVISLSHTNSIFLLRKFFSHQAIYFSR